MWGNEGFDFTNKRRNGRTQGMFLYGGIGISDKGFVVETTARCARGVSYVWGCRSSFKVEHPSCKAMVNGVLILYCSVCVRRGWLRDIDFMICLTSVQF